MYETLEQTGEHNYETIQQQPAAAELEQQYADPNGRLPVLPPPKPCPSIGGTIDYHDVLSGAGSSMRLTRPGAEGRNELASTVGYSSYSDPVSGMPAEDYAVPTALMAPSNSYTTPGSADGSELEGALASAVSAGTGTAPMHESNCVVPAAIAPLGDPDYAALNAQYAPWTSDSTAAAPGARGGGMSTSKGDSQA